MIARAFVRQDPFEVWGTGEQLRNWTYVSDIVAGTLKAAHCKTRGGLQCRHYGSDKGAGCRKNTYSAPATLRASSRGPTCRPGRIADNAKLFEHTAWRPSVMFAQGLAQTMDWYYATKSAADIEVRLPELLIER